MHMKKENAHVVPSTVTEDIVKSILFPDIPCCLTDDDDQFYLII